MRLIAEFKDEKQAFGFQAFLKKEGIESFYDTVKTASESPIFRLWIIEEDDFDKTWAFYQAWEKDPHDVRFEPRQEKMVESPAPAQSSSQNSSRGASKWKIRMTMRGHGSSFSLNNFIIVLCCFIFVWNLVQEERLENQKGKAALQFGFTPIQKKLLFDYPVFFVQMEEFLQLYPIRDAEDIKELSPEGQACFKKIQDAPTWKGVEEFLMQRSAKSFEELPPGTLFGKIRQGEIWRLISPVLLHASLLHILFNMAWVWVLGQQIEPRLGALRYLILSLIIGLVSNVCQYLVSGPVFAGYSGIVVGLVGFIWMRQKLAPWEGYPLQKPIIVFIAIFVFAMLGLEIVSMALQYFHVTELSATIANTAHLVGGVTGICLARLPFFSRSHK